MDEGPRMLIVSQSLRFTAPIDPSQGTGVKGQIQSLKQINNNPVINVSSV